MSLEKRLRALAPGQQVSIADIARKQCITEGQEEEEILALLERDSALGSQNVFAGVFTRALNPEGITDSNLGETLAALKQAYVDWETVQSIDNAVARASAADRVIQRANAILELVGHIGGSIAGKAWDDIDLSKLSVADRAGLREALELLVARKTKDGGQVQFPGNATLWFQAGRVADKLGWPQEASRFYEASLALDPKFAPAWNNLGVARKNRGDLKGAIENYRQALAFDPNYTDAWYNLGIALAEQADLAGAIEAFERAVALDPKHTRSWNNLGVARKARGN